MRGIISTFEDRDKVLFKKQRVWTLLSVVCYYRVKCFLIVVRKILY